MKLVRLVDALAMTLLFIATLAGLVNLVQDATPPVNAGQWSVIGAQVMYCVLGPVVILAWRKRRTWLSPVAWAWAFALTWSGGAAARFYGGADWRAAGAAFLAGGIIAAVTVWWITQRNVLAPMSPRHNG